MTSVGSGTTAVRDFQITPYLLNRDLDPASNANAPAFMDAPV
jgi:hypothetical protein